MWSKTKSREFVTESLRRLRRRVLTEGSPFFRVIDSSGNHRDFCEGSDGGFDSVKTAKRAAFDCALDLASCHVGSSVFVSERRELDGVQVLVKCTEVSYCYMEGFQNGR